MKKILLLFLLLLPLFPSAVAYYGVSPYAYCAGDPVNRRDVDGRKIYGADGKLVSVTDGSISTNATDDVRTLFNAMYQTNIGQTVFNNMLSANHPITIRLINSTYAKEHPDGGLKQNTPIAITKVTGMGSEIIKADIEFYMADIEDVWATSTTNNLFDNPSDPRSRYSNYVSDRESLSLQDVIGGTGVHEGTHATDKMSNVVGEPIKERREIRPIINEIEYIKQLSK